MTCRILRRSVVAPGPLEKTASVTDAEYSAADQSWLRAEFTRDGRRVP